MQIELTDDERDVLWAVLYCLVGGSPEGPRKEIDSIMEKLAGGGAMQERYTADIETVHNCAEAIVIREY
jgi:hypothetical protein